MRHRTATTTVLATATLAAALLTSCSGDGDDDRGSNRDRDVSSEDQADDTGAELADDEQPAGAAEGDLALGTTYTWDNGLAVTVDNLREVPAADLGEFDFVEEGDLPFIADVTIANGSGQPFDLVGLQPNAEGATQGGRANNATFEGIGAVGFYEGRLAPGETLDSIHGWTISEDAGRDVVIEAFRNDDWELPMPTWIGTIAPAE